MTHPSPDQIGVALDAMRSESALWHREGERLAELAHDVPKLAFGRIQGLAIYGSFVRRYNEAVHIFASRCDGGTRAFYEISLRLGRVADIYAAEEAANLHELNNLY